MKKYILGIILILLIGSGIVVLSSPKVKPTVINKPLKKYIALGDSVAAGVGLTPDRDSSACGRTNQSYPYLIAKKLQYELIDFSCTGATLSAGIVGAQNVNNLMETPQLDALFSSPNPDMITVTIGANDAGWTQFIGKCLTSLCGSPEDLAQFDSKLATVSSTLHETLAKITEHYGNNSPLILVTGYYHVFPLPGVNCAELNGIDPSELSFMRHQQSAITSAVQAAVTVTPNLRYVPIDFSGHELCTDEPWVQGISDKQPYHPTAAGQAAIARQIELEATSIK